MRIVWINSSLSGLCDRLVDLFLMVAMARVMGCELIVPWKINKNFTQRQLEVWDKARFEDYKYENFSQYFNLPKDLIILTEEEFSHYNAGQHVQFTDYLGGVFTPSSFYERYMKNTCRYDVFKLAHEQVVSEFTPKKKLLEITGEQNPDLAIHLRRGDKVNENPNDVEISNSSLQSLDEMTKSCADKIVLESLKPQMSVFICSDETTSLSEYEKRYKSMGCILSNTLKDCTKIERTYVDLLLLSRSKIILMSQKHSNFSLFASQFGRTKLVYFYADNAMIKDSNAMFHLEV